MSRGACRRGSGGRAGCISHGCGGVSGWRVLEGGEGEATTERRANACVRAVGVRRLCWYFEHALSSLSLSASACLFVSLSFALFPASLALSLCIPPPPSTPSLSLHPMSAFLSDVRERAGGREVG